MQCLSAQFCAQEVPGAWVKVAWPCGRRHRSRQQQRSMQQPGSAADQLVSSKASDHSHWIMCACGVVNSPCVSARAEHGHVPQVQCLQLPLEQCGAWARACPGVGQGKSFCVSVCCRGWSVCLARAASAHRNAPHPPSLPAMWHSLCVSWWRVRHLTAVCEPCCADHHVNRPRCVARTRGPCWCTRQPPMHAPMGALVANHVFLCLSLSHPSSGMCDPSTSGFAGTSRFALVAALFPPFLGSVRLLLLSLSPGPACVPCCTHFVVECG